MNSLIGRPVYCAVSQNGALPARINASIYSIDTTFYVLFPYVIDYVFRNSDAIIAKKQQKMMSQKKEHMRPGLGLRFVSVYVRTVRTHTGTKLTRLGPATETKSDRSEFISRPVSCKCEQRNVWRPIRTHAGLSSSRTHVNTPLVSYRTEFVPFSCKRKRISDRVLV